MRERRKKEEQKGDNGRRKRDKRDVRGYLHETGTNSDRYEIFPAIYMKLGRNAWCMVMGRNDIFCLVNISLTPKYTGLKFAEICYHLNENGTNSDRYENSRLGPAMETTSDRSEFIVRLVSCRRKKNTKKKCIEADTNSSRSEFLSSSRSRVETKSFYQTQGPKLTFLYG